MSALLDRIATFTGRVEAIPGQVGLRWASAMVALPAWTVVGIARWLTPSPDGFGTHTQLGLGGCTMLTVTGWPCPMCGMTTTFSLMAHFRPLDALANQPFGVVLFLLTLFTALVGTVEALTAGGWAGRVWDGIMRHERGLALFLLVGMIAGWVYKCTLMHPEVMH